MDTFRELKLEKPAKWLERFKNFFKLEIFTKENEEEPNRNSITKNRSPRNQLVESRKLDLTDTDALSEFDKKIAVLEHTVDKVYLGPCFDETYNVLNDQCCQYQMQLDTLEVTGRVDLQQKRKKCIIRIDDAAARLNRKTHGNGLPCEKCKSN